jgi:hypothetical protein
MAPSEEQTALVMTEVETTGSAGQPAWVAAELPPQYAELAGRIAALQQEARKYEDIAAVLWQTGPQLTRAVGDLFAALGFDVEHTEPGASYDLRVTLTEGRRLLTVVVGSSDSMTRRSPQLVQVLRALQDDAGERDRVVIAANIQFDTPVASRRQDPVTADGLRLVQGLGANFVATSTLFGIWRYSLQDLAGARKSVLSLHTQDGGIFR